MASGKVTNDMDKRKFLRSDKHKRNIYTNTLTSKNNTPVPLASALKDMTTNCFCLYRRHSENTKHRNLRLSRWEVERSARAYYRWIRINETFQMMYRRLRNYGYEDHRMPNTEGTPYAINYLLACSIGCTNGLLFREYEGHIWLFPYSKFRSD